MAQPIYKLWFMRYKEAWYTLTPVERNQLMSKDQEFLKESGAESIVMCVSGTFNEKWLGWGVDKYPNLEAIQKHTMRLFEIDWFKYIESQTYLGTEMPPM